MTVVCEATQAPVAPIRVAAFECLVKIAALYYDKIGTWMQNVFNVSNLTPQSVVLLRSNPFYFLLAALDYAGGDEKGRRAGGAASC